MERELIFMKDINNSDALKPSIKFNYYNAVKMLYQDADNGTILTGSL